MPHLTICETVHGVVYHLRDAAVPGNRIALCGLSIGWDTSIPISAWRRDERSRWCSRCEEKAGAAPVDAGAKEAR
jgi:hypothetical protein